MTPLLQDKNTIVYGGGGSIGGGVARTFARDRHPLTLMPAVDEATFSLLVERHRRELQVHCYRTAATYLRPPGDTEFRAFKLDVLRVEGGRIAEITTFDASLFPEFGLPPVSVGPQRP
jgi:hypothetical protein